MIKKLLSIILFAFLSSCISSNLNKYPQWYLTPPANDGEYIYGVGEGADPEESRQAALSDAASRLQTSVSSKFESAYQEDNLGSSSTISQKISAKGAQISFNNYKVVKSESLQNSYVTLVSIEKRRLIDEYTNELKQIIDKMMKLANIQGSKFMKRINIAKALEIGTMHIQKAKILNSIDSSTTGKEFISYTYVLDDSLSKINQTITIKIQSSNKNIEDIFHYAITKEGIATGNSGAKIIIDDSWQSSFANGINIVKLSLRINVYDGSNIVGSNLIESSYSSLSGVEIAKSGCIKKIKDMIEKDGVMKIIGLNI